jgi:Tn3 transposase DDE domain
VRETAHQAIGAHARTPIPAVASLTVNPERLERMWARRCELVWRNEVALELWGAPSAGAVARSPRSTGCGSSCRAAAIHAAYNRRYFDRRRGVTLLRTTADHYASLHTVVITGTHPDARASWTAAGSADQPIRPAGRHTAGSESQTSG